MNTCVRCGEDFLEIFRVPDDVWDRVSGHTDGSGILCWECCEGVARDHGIRLHWSAHTEGWPDGSYPMTPTREPTQEKREKRVEWVLDRIIDEYGRQTTDELDRNVLLEALGCANVFATPQSREMERDHLVETIKNAIASFSGGSASHPVLIPVKSFEFLQAISEHITRAILASNGEGEG